MAKSFIPMIKSTQSGTIIALFKFRFCSNSIKWDRIALYLFN